MQAGIKTFTALITALLLLAGVFGVYYHTKPAVIRGGGPETPMTAFARQFQDFRNYADSVPPPLKDIALFDMQDQKHSLLEAKGRWLVVNFWAVWCAPCVKEIPTLEAMRQQFADKSFDVVYISLDYPPNAAFLKASMDRLKIPSIKTYYAADETVWDVYNITALPMSLVVNPDGAIMYRALGDADWSSKEVTDFINSLL